MIEIEVNAGNYNHEFISNIKEKKMAEVHVR